MRWVLPLELLSWHPLSGVVGGRQRPGGTGCGVLPLLAGELVVWSILLPTISWLVMTTYIQHLEKELDIPTSVDSSTHLPWIWSFHALHTHGLRPRSRVALLRHSLAVGPKRPHALAPRLVHSHWGTTHIGHIHSWTHVSRERWWAARSRLVHELVVVCLVWSHLERGTHLEKIH